LPRLQKLAEQYQNQPGALFLSLDVDDDPGLAEPFLKQHKLTVPVLPAYDYATDTLKFGGTVPQNWIVGPNEVVCLKGVGYDATSSWEQGMKAAIERCESQTSARAVSTTSRKAHPSS
jgi:hypothetical protein